MRKLLALFSVILICLSSLSTVATVFASESLTLEPSEGPAGTIVRVNGSGFSPGESYVIYFDIDNDSRLDYANEPYTTVTADSDGDFTSTLTIPSVPSGTYHVRVSGHQRNAPPITSAEFTIRTVFEKLTDVQSAIIISHRFS